MNLGFDTIGNATLICYDGKPILVNDPWINGSAYFGSWGYSHEIPEEQLEAILACQYVWFSHGHPDHLNPDSLEKFRGKKILLPDHVGERIKTDLLAQGHDVSVLADRKWHQLSNKIKVMCLANENQDAILLIDINGRLVVNLNDADLGPERSLIRKIVKSYDRSFALAYSGFGDADMINLYDESGNFIPHIVRSMEEPLGFKLSEIANALGTTHFIPFSAMHRFRRSDSIWANRFAPTSVDFSNGFNAENCELLPMFVRYDCESDEWHALNPKEIPTFVQAPEEFGDNWSEQLSATEAKALEKYFRSFQALGQRLDFLNFRIGGKDHIITFAKEKFNRGITFEAPRASLMTCVQYEIFDDILIGNYMKTTLHGQWENASLTSEFTRFVAKYGDNGKAKTEDELRQYFRSYSKRAPIEHIWHTVEQKGKNRLRNLLANNPKMLHEIKSAYRKLVNLR